MNPPFLLHLSRELLFESLLESLGVSSELADTLAELLDGHLLLVEGEAEGRLVVDVGLALNVLGRGGSGIELLGDGVGAVEEFLQQIRLFSLANVVKTKSKKTYRNGQVVTASKLSDLASVTERGAHDNGLVAKLLVVVEDGLDRRHAGVVLLGVLLLGGSLVPVEDTADKGGDEESVGLGSGDGLGQGEQQSQVAVDAVVALKNLSGLDALPGGSDLDQDTVLGDALLLVELCMMVSIVVLEAIGTEGNIRQ